MHSPASGYAISPGFNKLLMVAKFTALFLCLLVGQASARLAAQPVSLKVKNEKLENVLREIKRQTRYDYVYNARFSAEAKTITLDMTDDLAAVLRECFRNQPFTYEITDKIIVIKERPAVTATPKNAEAAPLVSTPPPPPTVHGRIINDKGEPVAGVTISIKNGKVIGTTNDNGEFTLTNVPDDAVLVFSAITIEKFETALRGRTELALSAKVKVSELEEVVINKGYYSTTQKLNTGSVEKVKSDVIERQPVGNFMGALQGSVPGLQITQTSGLSSKRFVVQLRGINSIQNGTEPLYIIDGVPISATPLDNSSFITPTGSRPSSPLYSINIHDIESVEVLKDADATAIYGSRGANGVILITTKKGKVGKTRFNFNINTGAGQVTRMADLLNREQYLSLRHEAMSNDNIASLPTTAYDLNGKWDTTRYTDWQKLFIGGTATTTDVNASLSGGNQGSNFLIGANYRKETTVFPGDWYDKKGGVHFNFSHASIDGKLKMNLSTMYTITQNYLSRADFAGLSTLALSPVAPALYDSTGKLNWQAGTWTNPFSNFYRYGRYTTNFLNSNFDVSYQIFPQLRAKVSLGYSTQNFKQVNPNTSLAFNPSGNVSASATTDFGNQDRATWLIEPQIDYRLNLGRGNFTLTFGNTTSAVTSIGSTYNGTGYSTDALIESLAAANTVRITSNDYTQYKYIAFWGRVAYNYQDKYIVNITGRRDGSSRFGPGKQFANFGATGVAWIFSNEKFFQSLNALSFGKLRASYGITGNDQIGDYGFLNTYTPYPTTYQGSTTLYPVQLFNTDFAWERTNKAELSLDLGFLHDRIMLSTSFFLNRSSNQLVNYALPSTTGFTSVIENFGAVVENKGLEFKFNTTNIKTKNFSWSSTFNINFLRNKLIGYPEIEKSSYATRFIVGQSLNILQIYHALGVDPTSGLYIYEDYDKDGKISSPNDQKYIIDQSQKYYGGFQNTLQYKGLELNISFLFVRQPYVANSINSSGLPLTTSNNFTYLLDRWQSPGQQAAVQKMTNSNSAATAAFNLQKQSSNAYSDGSFIRLKNLSLSYTVPPTMLRRIKIQSLRLYVQGENLITITKYMGLDPETKNNTVPPLKILTGGVQITL